MSQGGISTNKFEVIIDRDLCKGCEICVDKCPFGVFELSNTIGGYGVPIPEATRVDKCTGCNVCVIFCPDMSITVKREIK
ncbi:MAG: ferredoxin family protein [Thermoplasmatales archaeon]